MIGLALLAALAAQPGGDEPQRSPPAPAAAARNATEAERLLGEMLLERFECARCHQLERHTVVQDRSCVDCHRAIVGGTLPAPPELLSRWRGNLKNLLEVPSLRGAGGVLRARWIEQYLLRPHDLRRGLTESMPRLSIKPSEARAIAHALTGGKEPPSGAVRRGDAARGLAVLEAKGCTTCHAYTGAGRALGTTAPAGVEGEQLARGIKLAPDLRA
ncbi:MAG: cytochrome C oxidase Cbb3, partial [Deltaproteobacteria bacterium]|nr:cytochrome C oxidase Cbb3 [Deltaproteobacteria bacterium]